MTPEQIEFHRKRFDEVCGWKSEHVLRKDSKDILFQGYLMAIESIEIELPEKHATERHDDEWAFNRAIERCEDAIQLLGMKVKER